MQTSTSGDFGLRKALAKAISAPKPKKRQSLVPVQQGPKGCQVCSARPQTSPTVAQNVPSPCLRAPGPGGCLPRSSLAPLFSDHVLFRPLSARPHRPNQVWPEAAQTGPETRKTNHKERTETPNRTPENHLIHLSRQKAPKALVYSMHTCVPH